MKKRYFEYGQQDVSASLSRFYAKDHLGSVWETLDGSGNSLASFSFDPWGRRTRLSGTDYLDVGFTGFYFHYQSGLDLAWFRQYDPNLGRWLNRDPKEEDGGLNLYSYVENNSIRGRDTFGLCPVNPAGLKKCQDTYDLQVKTCPILAVLSGLTVGVLSNLVTKDVKVQAIAAVIAAATAYNTCMKLAQDRLNSCKKANGG